MADPLPEIIPDHVGHELNGREQPGCRQQRILLAEHVRKGCRNIDAEYQAGNRRQQSREWREEEDHGHKQPHVQPGRIMVIHRPRENIGQQQPERSRVSRLSTLEKEIEATQHDIADDADQKDA
jgi:hypothetical protein